MDRGGLSCVSVGQRAPRLTELATPAEQAAFSKQTSSTVQHLTFETDERGVTEARAAARATSCARLPLQLLTILPPFLRCTNGRLLAVDDALLFLQRGACGDERVPLNVHSSQVGTLHSNSAVLEASSPIAGTCAPHTWASRQPLSPIDVPRMAVWAQFGACLCTRRERSTPSVNRSS